MRERLFLGFGFDLFEVGDFSEYLVCRLCGARQTGKTAGPDGIIPAENEMIRIEVKHSSGRKQVMGGVERLRYEFKNTSREEVTRKHVSVLVGVAKVRSSLRFFVFPLHLLKKRGSKKSRNLELRLHERKRRSAKSLLEFEVGPSDLRWAIIAAHKGGADYKGYFPELTCTDKLDVATRQARRRALVVMAQVEALEMER